MSEQQTKSLKELIETIVERGTLSPEDQHAINQTAFSTSVLPEDAEAVVKLTDMISGGRITVV